MNALREKMKMDLQIKGYSPNTQKAYLKSNEKYESYYMKSPEALGVDEIRRYLHLFATRPETSASTLDIIYSALKFLYETTRKMDEKVTL